MYTGKIGKIRPDEPEAVKIRGKGTISLFSPSIHKFGDVFIHSGLSAE